MDQCEICRAHVRELRRGRCWGCYSRWVEARPVGIGAVCRICGERRHSYLKSIELLGSWSPVCHGCAGRIAALDGVPKSVPGIRAALGRERRASIRRLGRADGRAFPYERRATERRADEIVIEVEAAGPVDDQMIIEIEELAQELDALGSDLTCIRQL